MIQEWYKTAAIEGALELIRKIDESKEKNEANKHLKKYLALYLKYSAKENQEKVRASLEMIKDICNDDKYHIFSYDTKRFLKLQFQCELVASLIEETEKFQDMWSGTNQVYYHDKLMDSSRKLPFIYKLTERRHVKKEDFDNVYDIFKRIDINGSDDFKAQYDKVLKAFQRYQYHFGGPERVLIRNYIPNEKKDSRR